jgi:aconitase A
MKQPIDVPPMISVDLIQISEKTALPFAPKAKEIIEKIKEEKERVVKKQAPPKKTNKKTKTRCSPNARSNQEKRT